MPDRHVTKRDAHASPITTPLVSDEFQLRLTPSQAEFVHRIGRHLRKQEGWWDAPHFDAEYAAIHEMFEALPWNATALSASSTDAEASP